jgi:quercetin dioxygenase-like cupin family protein
MSRLKQGMEQCRSHAAARGRPPRDRRITSLAQCASDPLFQAGDPARVSGGHVTFEPGARSAWHTHPLGQTLIVTSGLGWVQAEGGPIEEIRPGDVVWFPPGLKHWHWATPTTAMTHIAITEFQDGKNVDWLEKVSDEQYQR